MTPNFALEEKRERELIALGWTENGYTKNLKAWRRKFREAGERFTRKRNG